MLFLFIKITLFIIAFILEVKYRRQLAVIIKKIKLPLFLLYLLAAAILLVIEEHVNCGGYGCTNILIPPTVPFLMIQVLILGILVRLFHNKNIYLAVLPYCIFGILWELFIGGLKGIYSLPILSFGIPFVGISYAFFVIVPLTILVINKN